MAWRVACEAGSCLHNAEGDCSAKVIQVRTDRPDNDDKFCNTYVSESDGYSASAGETESPDGVLSGSMYDAEIAGSMMPGDEGGVAIICLEQVCRHNDDFHCKAAAVDVEVSDPVDEGCTNCRTFQPGK